MRWPRLLAFVAAAACAVALAACNSAPPAPVVVRETPSALGPKAKDALRIHVIDVDSGNCVLIECPESNTSGPHALLNDCGSNRAKTVGARVAAYVRGVLAGYGPRSVDILVSHPDADHYNLITSLFAGDEGIVGEVAVSGVLADYKLTHFPEFAARHPAFATLAPTQTTRLRPCGALTPVVLVADLPGRPNRRSAVLWLDYGEFLVLDPGDAQGKTETQALDNQAAADLAPDEEPLAGTLLLASHHGAATARSNSQNWIANVKPSLVLVSAGDPRSYGHPRCAVVERYLAAIPKEAAKHYLACPESKRDWNHTIATTGNIFSTHDCGDLVVTYTPSDDPPVALKFDGSCDVPTETGRPAIPTVSGS